MKLGITLGISILLLVVTYFSFSAYTPKSLRELKEVKGTSTSRRYLSVYPTDAFELGTFETEFGSQTTFSTSKSPEQVQTFYQNVFVSKGWENTKTTYEGEFLVASYKDNVQSIKVSSYKPEDSIYTIVNIDTILTP